MIICSSSLMSDNTHSIMDRSDKTQWCGMSDNAKKAILSRMISGFHIISTGSTSEQIKVPGRSVHKAYFHSQDDP